MWNRYKDAERQKVNDAVWKKTKKEEKANQKEKENYGVFKTNVARL